MSEKLPNNRAGRMVKAYLILIATATSRQTITYGHLANQLGVANQSKLHLRDVARFCKGNGHPDLTWLVVNSETGMTTSELDPASQAKIREEIYRHEWLDYAPPTLADWPKIAFG